MIPNNTYQSKFDRSPTYMTERSYQNQPSYSNQSAIAGANHISNPQINYTACGAAFAALPAYLGGNTPGNRSRFSGVPNW